MFRLFLMANLKTDGFEIVESKMKKKGVERKRSFFFRNSKSKNSNSDDDFHYNLSRNNNQRKHSVRSFESEQLQMKKNGKKDKARMSLFETQNIPMFHNENQHSHTIDSSKTFIYFINVKFHSNYIF